MNVLHSAGGFGQATSVLDFCYMSYTLLRACRFSVARAWDVHHDGYIAETDPGDSVLRNQDF